MGRQLFTTNMFVATLKRLRNTALQVTKKCVSQPTLITVFQGKWPFPFMVEVDTFRSKPFFLQCKRFRKSNVCFFCFITESFFCILKRTIFFAFCRIVFVPEENLFCVGESSEDEHSDESPSESLKLSEIQGSDLATLHRNASQ